MGKIFDNRMNTLTAFGGQSASKLHTSLELISFSCRIGWTKYIHQNNCRCLLFTQLLAFPCLFGQEVSVQLFPFIFLFFLFYRCLNVIFVLLIIKQLVRKIGPSASPSQWLALDCLPLLYASFLSSCCRKHVFL